MKDEKELNYITLPVPFQEIDKEAEAKAMQERKKILYPELYNEHAIKDDIKTEELKHEDVKLKKAAIDAEFAEKTPKVVEIHVKAEDKEEDKEPVVAKPITPFSIASVKEEEDK